MRLLALPGRFRRNVLCRYRYAFLLSCQRSGHRELPRQRSGYQVTMPQPELHCAETHMLWRPGDMTRRLAVVAAHCPRRELQARPLLYHLHHLKRCVDHWVTRRLYIPDIYVHGRCRQGAQWRPPRFVQSYHNLLRQYSCHQVTRRPSIFCLSAHYI